MHAPRRSITPSARAALERDAARLARATVVQPLLVLIAATAGYGVALVLDVPHAFDPSPIGHPAVVWIIAVVAGGLAAALLHGIAGALWFGLDMPLLPFVLASVAAAAAGFAMLALGWPLRSRFILIPAIAVHAGACKWLMDMEFVEGVLPATAILAPTGVFVGHVLDAAAEAE